MPAQQPPPIQCTACAAVGRAEIEMRFVMFEEQWMNVSTSEPDATYHGAIATRTQRKKVRSAVWRCPHGHQHQHISE